MCQRNIKINELFNPTVPWLTNTKFALYGYKEQEALEKGSLIQC